MSRAKKQQHTKYEKIELLLERMDRVIVTARASNLNQAIEDMVAESIWKHFVQLNTQILTAQVVRWKVEKNNKYIYFKSRKLIKLKSAFFQVSFSYFY